MARVPNPKKIKIHRSYTIEEAARACGVHRNTVRNWIKNGLAICDGRRPILILGRVLRAHLEDRRAKAKRPCGPGLLFCLKCRAPRPPAGSMLDYRPAVDKSGTLIAMCATCGTLMYRRVRYADIDRVRGVIDVSFPEAERHIGESK